MDRVEEVLAPVVRAEGLELEEVSVQQAGRRRVVRVVVDLPEDEVGALELDRVADVSRAVSQALDETDVLGGSPYVLEVGSPGVDRPLTMPRHWRRARTRLVKVTVGDRTVTGRVTATDDHGVTLDVDGTEHGFAYADLGAGRMQVEFKHTDEEQEEV